MTEGAGRTVDYPSGGLELMEQVEDVSPWYRERNRLVGNALAKGGLPDHLVEVGAGNGGVSEYLRSLGVNAVAVEPSRLGAASAASRGVPSVCGTLADLELPDESVGAAAVLDVLEHIPRPHELLRELHRVLTPGGRLVVTVPAMPSLWSHADELAGHHRRYTRGALVSETAAAGFALDSCRYAFGLLVPAVFLMRALPDRIGLRRSEEREAVVGTRQVSGYGSVLRRASDIAFAAERVVRRVADPPFGTSLIGTFSRPV